MNNIRHDSSHHWINNDEVDRQINEFADSSKNDRDAKLVLSFQEKLAELDRRKAQGYNVDAEIAEIKLQHRLNAASPHVHHETRWKQRNEVVLERKKIEERMQELANRYRAKRIDDYTYYQRHAKLKTKFDELGKQL